MVDADRDDDGRQGRQMDEGMETREAGQADGLMDDEGMVNGSMANHGE